MEPLGGSVAPWAKQTDGAVYALIWNETYINGSELNPSTLIDEPKIGIVVAIPIRGLNMLFDYSREPHIR